MDSSWGQMVTICEVVDVSGVEFINSIRRILRGQPSEGSFPPFCTLRLVIRWDYARSIVGIQRTEWGCFRSITQEALIEGLPFSDGAAELNQLYLVNRLVCLVRVSPSESTSNYYLIIILTDPFCATFSYNYCSALLEVVIL